MKPMSRKKSKQRRKSVKKHSVLNMPEVPQGTFPVIDYGSKMLFLPMEAMVETRALHREGVPSLCRIYMSGRCLQGSKCHQAHTDAKLVSEFRAIALAEPSCCEKHGVSTDSSEIHADFSFTVKDDKRNRSFYVGPYEYCITKGLRDILADRESVPEMTELTVPFSSLCKLHTGAEGTKCCRFGSECKFVHICRELLFAMEGSILNSMAASVELPLKHEFSSTHQFMKILTSAKDSLSDVKDRALGVSMDPLMSGSLDFNSQPSTQPESLNLLTPPPSSIRYRWLQSEAPIVTSYGTSPVSVVWRHNPYPSSLNLSSIET
ncbi:unnamed protein product [Phytomonas sp. Hart1]|nr:unnamed protein product [Phytomonas sp. Hart1]|eukprot:CCW68549.1 unnamed protein product [Phytomonas sp. isolate Hart1]